MESKAEKSMVVELVESNDALSDRVVAVLHDAGSKVSSDYWEGDVGGPRL
jgi:hypothetical protein